MSGLKLTKSEKAALLDLGWRLTVRYPRLIIGALLLMVLIGLAFWFLRRPPASQFEPLPEGEAPEMAATGEFLFCFWNVENLFDDHFDKRENRGDREYDGWFAENAADRQLKYDRLSDALVKLNGGRGPDILAIVEVESTRSAELLQEALNRKLRDPRLHYRYVSMKNLNAGRHIAPAVITRVPVREKETHLHGRMMRVLESHLEVNGHDLAILTTHWTSHVSDDKGNKRANYAELIYSAFKTMYRKNPNVDCLICGDFNDSPDSPAVLEHLHTTANLSEVMARNAEPRLLNLMQDKDPRHYGTHYYSGKWLIYDQIVVSPGLVDRQGWSVDPNSVRVVNELYRQGDKQQRPWRFGGEREKGTRGYSDHFPVLATLRVAN